LSFLKRVTRGTQIYLATPRLQGGLILRGVVAAVGAMVFVNTVVLVKGHFRLTEQDTALTRTPFGLEFTLFALVSPKLLEKYSERTMILFDSGILVISLGIPIVIQDWNELLPIWTLLGFGYSMIHMPRGRLLKYLARN
jgi:hypothetical protein